MIRRLAGSLAVLAIVVAVGACGGNDDQAANAAANANGSTSSAPTTVRLGYFANVTHAPAIVAVEKGFFQQRLGANKLETSTYNAGGDAINALLAGGIDAAYMGPNPAINGYQKSQGTAVRIVAGSTSGGAGPVVRSAINSVS